MLRAKQREREKEIFGEYSRESNGMPPTAHLFAAHNEFKWIGLCGRTNWTGCNYSILISLNKLKRYKMQKIMNLSANRMRNKKRNGDMETSAREMGWSGDRQRVDACYRSHRTRMNIFYRTSSSVAERFPSGRKGTHVKCFLLPRLRSPTQAKTQKKKAKHTHNCSTLPDSPADDRLPKVRKIAMCVYHNSSASIYTNTMWMPKIVHILFYVNRVRSYIFLSFFLSYQKSFCVNEFHHYIAKRATSTRSREKRLEWEKTCNRGKIK